MSIKVICPCGAKLAAPNSRVGKSARCPRCGTKVVVAEATTPDDDIPPADAAAPATAGPLPDWVSDSLKGPGPDPAPAPVDPPPAPRRRPLVRFMRYALFGLVAAGFLVAVVLGLSSTTSTDDSDGPAYDGRQGELLKLEGHADRVTGLAVSPNGRFAVTAGDDHSIRLWDLSTGKEVQSLTGLKGSVAGVAVSADGQRVAWASGGSQIRDGKISRAEGGDFACVCDLRTLAEHRRFSGHEGDVRAVALSPAGNRLVTGSWDCRARTWNLDTGQPVATFEGHSRSVYCVAVSPDGLRALSGAIDGTLCLWFVDSGRLIRRFEGHKECVNGVSFSPDGHLALSGGNDRTVRLWDVETGRELRSFKGHTTWVHAVAFSPDSKRAASASGGVFEQGNLIETDDNSVCVWDVASGELIRRLAGHARPVLGVAFLPDGKRVVSSSGDKTVRLWGLGE